MYMYLPIVPMVFRHRHGRNVHTGVHNGYGLLVHIITHYLKTTQHISQVSLIHNTGIHNIGSENNVTRKLENLGKIFSSICRTRILASKQDFCVKSWSSQNLLVSQ